MACSYSALLFLRLPERALTFVYASASACCHWLSI